MAKMTVTGIKELDRLFRQLPDKIGKKVARQSIRKALQPIKKAVEANAPRGETGHLSSSVKIRSAKKSRQSFGIDVRIGLDGWTGDGWYAAAQEYGTSEIEGSGFMRRAADEKRDEALTIVKREIADRLEQEIRKLVK